MLARPLPVLGLPELARPAPDVTTPLPVLAKPSFALSSLCICLPVPALAKPVCCVWQRV